MDTALKFISSLNSLVWFHIVQLKSISKELHISTYLVVLHKIQQMYCHYVISEPNINIAKHCLNCNKSQAIMFEVLRIHVLPVNNTSDQYSRLSGLSMHSMVEMIQREEKVRNKENVGLFQLIWSPQNQTITLHISSFSISMQPCFW